MEVDTVEGYPELAMVRVIQNDAGELVPQVASLDVCVCLLKGLTTLAASFPVVFSGTFQVRECKKRHTVVDWGHGFLYGSECTSHVSVREIVPGHINLPGSLTSPKDILAYIYLIHSKELTPELPSLRRLEYVPKLMAVDSEGFEDTVHDWDSRDTHNKILDYLQHPSGAGKLVQLMRSSSVRVPPEDRFAVYSFFLQLKEEAIVERLFTSSPDSSGFIEAFGRFLGECPHDKRVRILAEKFKNRILRNDATDMVFRLLHMVDQPLASHLLSIGGMAAVDQMVEGVFSSALSPDQLAQLWDSLLIDSPELLVRVTAFTLMELRELLVACAHAEAVRDVTMSTSELVSEFGSIVELAVGSGDLET
jgi:hypothetical protein